MPEEPFPDKMARNFVNGVKEIIRKRRGEDPYRHAEEIGVEVIRLMEQTYGLRDEDLETED